jgi:hypothetical protein
MMNGELGFDELKSRGLLKKSLKISVICESLVCPQIALMVVDMKWVKGETQSSKVKGPCPHHSRQLLEFTNQTSGANLHGNFF